MEHKPCLVCGEPKPDDKPCLNAGCAEFGGEQSVVTVRLHVVAAAGKMPGASAIVTSLIETLNEEGWYYPPDVNAETGDPIGAWLDYIELVEVKADA